MSERIKTLAGALLALFIIYALFFSTAEQPTFVTRPVTTEQGENGYYALHQWLNSEGISTYSLRERYSKLIGNREIAQESGNILITTMPHYRPIQDAEDAVLWSWIARGNTLLVLAALNDTSDWSIGLGLTNDLEDMTGVHFVPFEEESDDSTSEEAVADSVAKVVDDPIDNEYADIVDDLDLELDEDDYSPIIVFEDSNVGQEYSIEPHPGHPLMTGISEMTGVSHFTSYVWHPEADEFDLVLELATMPLTDTPVIWQKRYEGGQMIIVGSGTMLTNRLIASADNRKFVGNLVRNNLNGRGTVIFDDLHQGLSAIYDPDAFYADSRLHYTIYFIVGFWLLYIVGSSNRLLDPQPAAKALRQSEFIEAVGGFINRHMSPGAVGLWMYKSWFNDLRRHMGLQLNGEPLWQELRNMTVLDPSHLGKMQRQYDQLSSDRSVNLIDLHNTIHKARKAIG